MNLLKKILLVIITLSIVISFLFTLTGCPPEAPKEEAEKTTTEEITTTEEVAEGIEETVEQKEPSIKIISITGYNIETDTHYALANDTFKANITDVDIGLKLKNVDVKEDTITVSTYLNGIFDSSFPINDALEYDSGAYYFSIFYEDGGIYEKGNHKFIFKVNLKNVETVEFSVEPIEEEKVLKISKKIAFYSDRDGNGEIYTMNEDGSEQTRLTESPADEFYPTWSPDGKKIAFDSNRDGNWEIYVMNVDGSEQTRLTENPAEDGYPAWSPDGAKIAFTSFRDGNGEIYTMNADGSEQIRLTNNPADDGAPTWSPDGKKIAFISKRDENDEIYVMNEDGSEQINLTDNPAGDLFPDW